ncbi:hypothetical protein AJ79_00163 [Helicocarpus griseus UAMH5409]|uniref:Uncharacterized protein n=1 Tax=Helicocarpus griseus UAMH5409 TaxID=1447875 RepID=A0A2B7YC19_9EURO|nr:hypothetical protein AJ79_00163 [Helicocarpus griseus UAMH5409]
MRPTNGSTAPSKDESAEASLAQAFKNIASGERTASALENNLTNLEEKIEALLAAVEKPGNAEYSNSDGNATSSSDPDAKSSEDRTDAQDNK